MDILSHGLYGGVAFGRRTRRDYWIAFLFGVGPDILSFGIFFLSTFLGFSESHFGKMEPPDPTVIPAYVHNLYNITHSLVIYTIFCTFVVFR